MKLRYRYPSKIKCNIDNDILNNERLEFISKVLQFIENDYNLIYCDETTINRNMK